LFPERLRPGECPVLDHLLVPAPDVVDEDVDPLRLPGDTIERGRHLGIEPMVAANAGDALIDRPSIAYRSAGHKHLRPLVSERARDPAANAEGPTGHDSHLPLQRFHRANI
jgi:hypothetical protein